MAGFERVLVITPEVPFVQIESLSAQVERLQQNGARVEILHPNKAMNDVVDSVGGNPLDPSLRERLAKIGREQGRSIAARAAFIWR